MHYLQIFFGSIAFMEKNELLKKIEMLLSFDGNDISINPAYLDLFTVEELEKILKSLETKHKNMVKDHLEWMHGLKRAEDPK